MTVGERHDPDRELFGQGWPTSPPLFGGIPATAAIARTAVNVRAGRPRSWRPSPTPSHSRRSCWQPRRWSAGSRSPPWPVLLATTVRMVEAASLWALARATRATRSCWCSPSPSP
ncbi:SulP family inorganic anion transporter [Micromonospora sp. M12]